MKKTLFLFFLSCIAMILNAQNLSEVRGVVKDAETGEPLIGVNILVEGTQAGTVTGLDGDFSIAVSQNATIRISYVGYKTKTINYAGETYLTIPLELDAQVIEELVVVGYSVQKKRDVLGAISKVESTELSKIPVASTQQALQGRVAGVNVSAQTGAPGAPISVRIRGVNSISLSNDPLYIVDGIPVEGALNNISPNEIESMTVLKDASSAAIYGSRATNGVVLITTKSGQSGDAKINYNTQLGFQQHGRLTKMATTEQYISMYNEAARADNATSVVQRAIIEGAWVKDFPNVNHLEEIFRTAPFQSHEISISGGSEKTQYLIAGTIYKQDGIIKNTNYSRTNLRSNINSQVKKWLKVGLNISGGMSDNRLVSSSGDGFAGEGGSVVRYALFRNPAIPVYNATGNIVDLPSEYYGNSVYNSFFGDGYSPEGLTENTDRTRKSKTLLATGNVLITLPADLMLKTTAGIDYNNTVNRVYDKTWGTANRINSTNGLSVTTEDNFNWVVNTTLNHNISLNDTHNLSSMIGAEAIKNSGSGLYASESEFLNTDPDFLYLGMGSSKTNINQAVWESTLVSFFANVNYNFNQKYYLSGILRRDGSSRFSEGNKWGTFYSLSGGWNVETEDFMQDLQDIHKLKLRAGYGSIGNQNIPLYAYADRYGYNYYYTFGGNSYNGYAQTQLGNAELKWETSNQFNIGADLEFLKGSLGVTLDYYYKVTHDMLLPASLPPSIGNASPFQINSTGNVLNTGVDLEVFYRKNYKDGGFNIALNGGFLHNKVLKLDFPYFAGRVDTGVFATRTQEGHPIGSFYLYEMDGIFQNNIEVLTSAYQGNNIKPGDVKYVDQNEDNVIDAKDRTFLGSAIPTVTTGLNLAGNYKNFDVSMFFQGAFGQKIFSQVNFDIEGFYRGFNVTERYYREHWTGEGTSNTQPRASWAAKSNNVIASSRFLEDGSYFRLKNLQVGYTIPNTKKLGIENLRCYLAGTNLFTLTRYSGLDPEMTVSTNSASEGDMANGIDWGTYPVAMTFTFGINLTF
ncbi:MAG: TonB-dependent receptor [Paludibacter sp.]|nr:TonB-dependent receptor [Paludibacter sp.]